jgi:anti-sigma regulatory factor (Ser/Thr protein kinase)
MDIEPSSGIVLRTQPEELSRLALWTASLAESCSLSPILAHRIDLCLTEIVTNVVDYGYADGTSGAVSVHFWGGDSERVVFRVDDEGVPFDPTSFVPPQLPRVLADATIGGRGIRLVRHYANEIHYRRDAGTNQLTLVFHRTLSGQGTRCMDTCAPQ